MQFNGFHSPKLEKVCIGSALNKQEKTVLNICDGLEQAARLRSQKLPAAERSRYEVQALSVACEVAQRPFRIPRSDTLLGRNGLTMQLRSLVVNHDCTPDQTYSPHVLCPKGKFSKFARGAGQWFPCAGALCLSVG
eukprot:3654854-Amphidinium_carterae.1